MMNTDGQLIVLTLPLEALAAESPDNLDILPAERRMISLFVICPLTPRILPVWSQVLGSSTEPVRRRCLPRGERVSIVCFH